MKNSIVKKVSKLSVILVVFLMLTLVFTLYQTSVNAYVVDVVDELNIVDVENNPNILQIMPVTAEAISSFTYHTFWDSKSMSNTWGSVVEKKETYTATTSLENDAYKRAGYGNAIKFYAYYSVTSSGNGSQAFYVTASGGASSQNTLSMSNSSGSHSSTKYNMPGGTTTFTATLTMQTNGKAFTQQTATVADCRVYLEKADTTAPSISPTSSTTLNSEYWQTSNTVTVSDSGAGINTIRVTYTNLTGTSNSNTSLNYTASGTGSSNRSTSQTLTLSNQGKYVITVTDNVGNSSSKTVWYYDSVINATVNSATAGTAYVTTSSTASGSSSKLENLYGSQSYYLYATPKAGYYFTGWKGTVGTTATLGVDTCTYVDNKWRSASQTLPSSPTMYSEYTWQAQFSEIAPLLLSDGKAVTSGTTSFTYNYDGSGIDLKLGTLPSGYSGTIKYDGTTAANLNYPETTTAPTYAGTYTAYVTLTYKGSTIGSTSFGITINVIDVYAKPTFPQLVSGVNNSKIYDGNNVISQVNPTDWTLGSESASNSIITTDKLIFTTVKSDFVYADKHAGSGKNISFSTDATISSNKTTDTNTNLNIAASYKYNKSSDAITGTIAPKMLTFVSAGYGQCKDGEKDITSLKGYYVNGSQITSDLMGKVYDGKTSATFAGVILTGYVTDDDIGFAIGTKNSTPYKTKTNTSVSGGNNVGYIMQSFPGTFANPNAGTGKTITSPILFLAGNDRKNYYVSGITGNNSSTPYNDQEITIYQANCVISQKDVTIAIKSHSDKIYDGNDIATVIYTWVDVNGNEIDPIQEQDDGTSDNLYIDASKAVAKFSSAKANYYAGTSRIPTSGRYFNEEKTISATGLNIALGSATDSSVRPNTELTNYRLTSTSTSVFRGKAWAEDGSTYQNGFIAITTKQITLSIDYVGKVYDGNDVCYPAEPYKDSNGNGQWDAGEPFTDYNLDGAWNNAYYTWTSDECAVDKGQIIITSIVKYGDSKASSVSAKATNISISSLSGVHLNYHLEQDEVIGKTNEIDENGNKKDKQVLITKKSISDVKVASIPDEYYNGRPFYPTPQVDDENIISYNGEIFIDANGNGVYDPGESIIDLDGDGSFDAPAFITVTLTDTGDNLAFAYGYVGNFTQRSKDDQGELVHEHRVVISGAGQNYDSDTQTSVLFTILQASVKIEGVQDITIIYGQNVNNGNISATTVVNNEWSISTLGASEGSDIPVSGGWSFVSTVASLPLVADSGVKTIQFTPTDTWNYKVPETNELTLTVNKRPITITATSKSITFGSDISFSNTSLEPSPFDNVNHTGHVGGDSFGYVNCVVSDMVYSLPALDANGDYVTDSEGYWLNAEDKRVCKVGEYQITRYNALGEDTIGNNNYEITFVEGTFTITKLEIKLEANGATIIYGETEPGITFSITQGGSNNVTTSLIEGKLSRNGYGTEDGLKVGRYSTNNGTVLESLFNQTNYNLPAKNITAANLNINRRPVLIAPINVTNHYFGEPITIDQTAFTASKVEGETYSGVAEKDKAIPLTELFSIEIYRSLVNSTDSLDGSPINATVGTYRLLIKTERLNANPNYDMSKVEGSFTVIPRPIIITPTSGQKKDYDGLGIVEGDTFAYTVSAPGMTGSALVDGFGLKGALTRRNGANVGNYLIQQGTLNNEDGKNPNYLISFDANPVYYVIEKLKVTVTPRVVTISVGDPIPESSSLLFDVYPSGTPILGGVMIDGTPEGVGKYDIVANPEMAGDGNKNYEITVNGKEKFIIDPLTAIITPLKGQYATFGDNITFGTGEGQINLAFTVIEKNKQTDLSHLFLPGENGEEPELSGALSIDFGTFDGEYLPAGEYDIEIGSITAKEHDGKANYVIVFEDTYLEGTDIKKIKFTVNKKNVKVSLPEIKTEGTEEYVDANGNNQYDVGESFTDANGNNQYDVVYNLTKVYDGQKESSIEYYVNPEDLVAGYKLSENNVVARELGNTVGSYLINIDNFSDANYSFSLDKSYSFVISQRFIKVTPIIPEGQDKIYSVYGDNQATILYSTVYKFDETQPGLVGQDKLGGTLAIKQGNGKWDKGEEYVDVNGNGQYDEGEDYVDENGVTMEGYEILIGTLNSTDADDWNRNYVVEFDDNGIKYYVVRRDVTISANSWIGGNAQVFGDAEKPLSLGEVKGMVGSQTLAGSLTREAGIFPGRYRILQGSINNENNPNYNVIFKEGSFYEIVPRPITVSANMYQKKGYTDPDPVLGYTITGEVPGYEIGVTLTREKGETVNKYNYIFILEDNDIWENNKCYSFTQFTSTNNNEYGKRIFHDVRNPNTESEYMFTIEHGKAEIGFNDGTHLDENGNYVLTLEYNGQDQTIDTYLVKGGDEEYVDANGNGQYDEGEEFVDINENGVHDKAVTVNYRVNNKNGRTFKDAGTYTVLITAIANDNFEGAQVTVKVTVTPKDLGTVNPSDKLDPAVLTKVYGDDDSSNFSFTIDTEYGDTVTATIVRDAGENVGKYNFASIYIDNANYELSFEEGTNIEVFEITERTIDVVPTVKSIAYGEVLSSWDEEVYDVKGNKVTITYTRTDISNNNAQSYDIASYVIDSTNHVVNIQEENLKDVFVIVKRKAIVSAVASGKTFDGTAIDLTSLQYTVSGMVNNEIPVGSLTIIPEGNLDLINVGTYKIVAVGFDTESNSNYDMEFVSANYVIDPAIITITPVAISYVYGETIEPFTYTLEGNVYADYPLQGSLGEAIEKNVGDYNIPQGTLDNKEGRNSNYLIKFTNNVKYSITKRYVKIKVGSKEQIYGEPMPKFEYEFVDGTSMVGTETLHGTLSSSGKDVGTHSIILSDEFKNDNPNYEVDLDSSEATYTIIPRPLTITPDTNFSIYGEALVELSYTTDNLVKGDVLEGELECEIGVNAGTYPIRRGTLNNSNYDITFTDNVCYEILPREITVTINNASSEFGQEDAPLTYSITKGNLVGKDDLAVELVRDPGTEMGTYAIKGTHGNTNYSVTFVDGLYTIMKFKAFITVESQYVNFVENGVGRSITATCSSGAKITFTIDREEVHNFFTDAGKYVVVLTAPETDSYYAPDPVTVYITINRPFIQSEANGIDIKLETENGFDPSLSIEMNRLPQDFEDIQAELKSNQKIVRAFTLTTTSDQASTEVVPGKTTVTIKVPNALKDEEAVQVMVQEDGVYNLVEVDVIDGYVTLEVDSLSSFAFIQEESNNYLLLIIIGVAALIVLGSVMVFLFRKRA